jgi:hypothetical protein
MIIYKDLFSGDEMFTGIYKIKCVDDVLYEVEGKLTKECTQVDEKQFGFNASAEGGDGQEVDDSTSSKSGCNIVIANRLVQTVYDKKKYQLDLKAYMKRIVEHLEKVNPDRVDKFKSAAKEQAGRIFSCFKDWEFFLGESNHDEGMVALLNYREDGVTPYMLFWKDGLEEEKV